MPRLDYRDMQERVSFTQAIVTFLAIIGSVFSTAMILAIIYLIIVIAEAVRKHFEITSLF